MPATASDDPFTINGIRASAITGANGVAAATLSFATALPTGAGQLQINFAGDTSYQASSRAVPIQIYQPMPFVIWGGNSGGLRIGQRVNFWGSQWDSEGGLDNFGARSYSSVIGRWMTPDWSDAPSPIPYAKLTDP